MVFLKRALRAAIGIACLSGLFGCERDFSTSWLQPGSDSSIVAAKKPDTSKATPDPKPEPAKPDPIRIESLSATDLRLKVGETKSAPVTVLPANATSPLYEMTSSKPGVAEVTPDGIHGVGAGSATITVHTLDGSDRSTKFHVVVDALFEVCLLPCLCLGKAAAADGGGKGKNKEKEKAQEAQDPDCGD